MGVTKGAREPVRAAGPVRVLVVDDDEENCRGTARVLLGRGHAIRTAHTGREAIEQFNAFTPDLVLLDVFMDDMDGVEVVRRIRKTEGIKEPFIAAVSAHGELIQRRRCAAAGFDHYLVKPLDPLALDQLLCLVDERAALHADFVSLQRERISVCYTLARSQLEFGVLLMDTAATTREAASRERCLEKVQRLHARLGKYLAHEIGFSADQLCALQIMMRGLQVRLTTVKSARP